MKNKLMKMFGVICTIVLIINIVFMWISYFDLKEKGEEVVKCYDKYSNEIIGQECIDDNDYLSTTMMLTMLCFFAMALLSPFYWIDI